MILSIKSYIQVWGHQIDFENVKQIYTTMFSILYELAYFIDLQSNNQVKSIYSLIGKQNILFVKVLLLINILIY